MRPRANTISHVEGAAVGMMSASNPPPPRPSHAGHGHAHHPSLSGMSGIPGFDFRGMQPDNRHHSFNGLAKIDTAAIPVNLSDGLRTAPVFGSFNPEFGLGDIMLGQGTTINPAQLHFSGPPSAFVDTPTSPFTPGFPTLPTTTQSGSDDEIKYDWINGFDNTMKLTATNESAIDGSSPSAMSTGSQSGISEAFLDSSNQFITSSGPWTNPLLSQPQSNQFSLDFSHPGYQNISTHAETVSPKPLLGHIPETSFSPSPSLTSMPSNLPNNIFPNMGASPNFSSFESNLMRTGLPACANSITDSTRQALMVILQQPTASRNRRYSQSSSKRSQSTSNASRPAIFDILPSTGDLQRYIAAYINFFHPHLPFIHVPTLDFGGLQYASKPEQSNIYGNTGMVNTTAGSGCLLLSMAAIGALYEYDTATSKELFESAKRMIQLYLEERRKADLSATLNRTNSGPGNTMQNTPLWLVQAMLLNVLYGHSCDDKTAAGMASNHCAALVSLARAAELTQFHPPESLSSEQLGYPSDSQMNGSHANPWATQSEILPEKREWLNWKVVEERKRTLYAIFTLSSLLVSAYNHAPALTNSEIRLTLPCDEQLWAAGSPEAWIGLGGHVRAEKTAIQFADALKTLLTADQHHSQHSLSVHSQFESGMNGERLSDNDLKPSTFGCLVLIHALHNYVWEARQQHMGKQWTNQETEAMHMHIEPALRAWQSAWSSNPTHSLERPNPYGAGPLSADSIPLLDLAYVRLYVNLGRSKEAFWQQDWNSMSEELARSAEVAHAEATPSSDMDMPNSLDNSSAIRQDPMHDFGMTDFGFTGALNGQMGQGDSQHQGRPSKSERNLRKAAFYAADSICMSDKLGNTFVDFTSRELPIQSAMCLFDCAQVLAEWISTVQERTGAYLGILGQDPMDLGQVPAMMLLEDEDFKLIEKIEEILNSIEQKIKDNVPPTSSMGGEAWNCLPSLVGGGYGAKISFSAAYLLNRAGVWPTIKLMGDALEVQGHRMRQRAQHSVSADQSLLR